jgi:hypothetical protein
MRCGTTRPSARTATGLLAHDVIVSLFHETVETARVHCYLSGEHFSLDSTLTQAWAGDKSFVPKAKSSNDTPPDGGVGYNASRVTGIRSFWPF